MSSRLVLHIGANKTGSSAIQHFLRLNWRTLRDHGYFVPDSTLGLSDQVSGEHVFTFQQLFNNSNIDDLRSKLRALITPNAPHVIISAENLSNGSNFQHFTHALTGLDCRVILYIRRQDDLLTSSWQQWYSKTEVDINAWLILALQRYGHWQRCIEGWESVVGPGNVTVRVFQTADLIHGDVVDDFMHLLELEKLAVSFKRADSLVNPSYSDVITPFIAGNKLISENAHDNRFYNMVGQLTGDHYIGGPRVSLISPQQREHIIEFYRRENEYICRKYFPARPRLFEEVDHSRYEYLQESEMVRRQLAFLASLIYSLYRQMP
jgi:hypothetical protein